jgi:two-component system sensor histidine kinase VicK
MDEAFAVFSRKEQDKITPDLLLSMVYSDDLNYVEDKLAELLDGLLNASVEFRIVLDHEIHWVRLTPFLLNSEKERLIAANVADITAEINNTESVRKYANKKNSILNMLAHDLRGPLDMAHSLAKTIDRKTDDPGLLKLTNSISGILKQSLNLIASLIDRELIDTVEVELLMKRVDIVSKLTEYIEECKRWETATEREFKFSASSKSIYIELDEAKFIQIMNNLITNALKFTHAGGIISVDVSERGHSIIFTIKDNGIGIPEDLHTSLFDKFTKAGRAGLNGEPTLGLGLSIVKMLVEWHKGRIWFESQENNGSAFYFELPKSGAAE